LAVRWLTAEVWSTRNDRPKQLSRSVAGKRSRPTKPTAKIQRRTQGEQISSEMRSRADIETTGHRSVSQEATPHGPIEPQPALEQNSNGARSETEHAELLLADPVVRVDRLRLAEIGDRLGAAAQHFVGEAAVVVGLDIGRTELDRLREVCNRALAVTLCDPGLAAGVESTRSMRNGFSIRFLRTASASMFQ
jgi:hypothetical protein